ncbi:Thioredoxin-like fold [Phytophthora cactorum]|nr:Thioredoxin-like fold [Phytophthora cactorum]
MGALPLVVVGSVHVGAVLLAQAAITSRFPSDAAQHMAFSSFFFVTKYVDPAVSAQPQLYIYDHCPFCCRARVALGLKKVKYDVLFLANHDEATHRSCGLQTGSDLRARGREALPGELGHRQVVDEHYGDGAILKPASGREDLAKWFDTVMPLFTTLFLPRFHAAPLPEFTLKESRDYFKNKKEKSFGSFSENLPSPPRSSSSYDDLDLFSRLRGLTLVKGIEWPTKAGDVPLYDNVVKI